ncbi:hypothetical protein [Pigmentiphaga daeguensis]
MMDWKSLVSTAAPWLGTALGGPLGGLAVTAIADALGLSEKTEAAIKGALAGATQADLLALKQADQQFALRMQELGYQNTQALERIAADDRASARKRESELKDGTNRVLAYAVTAGFFCVLGLLLFTDVPGGAREALFIMLGVLGTAWNNVMSYYFGSTAGGKLKSDLLAQKS